jgi:hypothetical protein
LPPDSRSYRTPRLIYLWTLYRLHFPRTHATLHTHILHSTPSSQWPLALSKTLKRFPSLIPTSTSPWTTSLPRKVARGRRLNRQTARHTDLEATQHQPHHLRQVRVRWTLSRGELLLSAARRVAARNKRLEIGRLGKHGRPHEDPTAPLYTPNYHHPPSSTLYRPSVGRDQDHRRRAAHLQNSLDYPQHC